MRYEAIDLDMLVTFKSLCDHHLDDEHIASVDHIFKEQSEHSLFATWDRNGVIQQKWWRYAYKTFKPDPLRALPNLELGGLSLGDI